MFTCTVETTVLQWEAELWTNSVAFFKANSDTGRSVEPSDGIEIHLVDFEPLRTIMVIQGYLVNESFNFSCISTGSEASILDIETETYVSACT